MEAKVTDDSGKKYSPKMSSADGSIANGRAYLESSTLITTATKESQQILKGIAVNGIHTPNALAIKFFDSSAQSQIYGVQSI